VLEYMKNSRFLSKLLEILDNSLKVIFNYLDWSTLP